LYLSGRRCWSSIPKRHKYRRLLDDWLNSGMESTTVISSNTQFNSVPWNKISFSSNTSSPGCSSGTAEDCSSPSCESNLYSCKYIHRLPESSPEVRWVKIAEILPKKGVPLSVTPDTSWPRARCLPRQRIESNVNKGLDRKHFPWGKPSAMGPTNASLVQAHDSS